MCYTIGETAKILGISSELLRHYERLGIISPQRHANGYRCYDLDTIKKLTGVRRWRGMGFALEDAELLLASTRDNTLQLYRNRLSQMQEEMQWQQEVQAALLETVQEIETASESVGSFSVREMPDMLRIVNQHDHELKVCDAGRYRKWIDCMPVVQISPGFSIEDIRSGSNMHQFGYVTPLEKARQLGLAETENAQVIKAGLHASTVIFSEDADHVKARQLKFLLPLLQERGYTPTGDAWGITIGSFEEGTSRRKYHRIFLPIALTK